MPGYSFQPQFVEPILAGKKGGTIRLARRLSTGKPGGHCMPGDPLYLWCRQRTPGRFKIGDRTCVDVEPITLCLGEVRGVIFGTAGGYRPVLTEAAELNTFAVFDGFESWGAVVDFWRSTHKSLDRFEGWHIRWLPLPEAIAGASPVAARIEREQLREADFQAGRI